MNYICESKKHKYSKGYLYLPINLNVEKLPENITIQDTQLQIKSSFHVSLICIKNIEQDSGTENIGEKIINLFCEFIKENELIVSTDMKQLSNTFDFVNTNFKQIKHQWNSYINPNILLLNRPVFGEADKSSWKTDRIEESLRNMTVGIFQN
jgi:hypothetical protein